VKYTPYTLEDVKKASAQKKFSVISLFAGGGGSSTGYRLLVETFDLSMSLLKPQSKPILLTFLIHQFWWMISKSIVDKTFLIRQD